MKVDSPMVKNRMKVSVCGVSYSLVSDESEAHIFQAAQTINDAIKEMMEGGVERDKAAILVALQLASKILKQEEYERHQLQETRRLIDEIEHKTEFFVKLS